MTTTPRVLFIGHHGSRTGAPLLLLHFLKWLAANTPLPFEILLAEGGPLAGEYAAVAPTEVLGTPGRSPQDRLLRRLRSRLRLADPLERRLRRRYPVDAFPLVYANTVATGPLVGFFARRGHRVICHAHEMKFAMEHWGGPAARKNAPLVHAFVAASQAVKRDLVSTWGIRPERIDVIYEFGQPFALDAGSAAASRRRIRNELGIGGQDVVVGMCGTIDWRKGADLFLLLARSVRRRSTGTRFRFLWVGSPPSKLDSLQFAHDAAMLGLTDHVTQVGPVPNPGDYMAAFDVFALTSREDPCPLAMIESAALAVPTVCFADSGGATEFVRDDAGIAVPYLDVEAMAQSVSRLGADASERRRLGENARHRAAEEHSIETQAPKMLAVIEHHRRAALFEAAPAA